MINDILPRSLGGEGGGEVDNVRIDPEDTSRSGQSEAARPLSTVSGTRSALVLGALSFGVLGTVMFAANQAFLHGRVSQLAGDTIQYAAASLFGLVLIRTATRVIGDRLVHNILWTGLFFIVVSSVLNVTNDVRALNAWPLLGIDSRLNGPVKEACELLSIVIVLIALVAAILSLKKTRDELFLKHEALLAEVAKREESEAKRAELEQQFRQAQKLEAIGQLTGGIAHDFNNLLQVINGYTEMAMEAPEDELHAREALMAISSAGERATRLVSQLLTFSRRQVMRLEYLDVNDTIANLLKLLGRVIGEDIQLEWRPGVRVGTIHADRGMLEQTLMNLCVNARDAMSRGGNLTIATRDVSYEDELPCPDQPWAKPGRYVLLSVSDTGCGMNAEVLEHVFEPFFTTKEAGSGTGLGLATVYGIVRQHAGMIDVASEPGRGTTFSLYWPVSEAETETPEFEGAEDNASRGTETILLVEDDEAVRRLARTLLERAGYTVLTAQNGTEALKLLDARGKDVELAILDVVMPEMGGREVYERMNKLRPGLRVLFASGYSEGGVHTNFVVDTGLNLLQKPFTHATLLHAVRNALDHPVV